MAKTKNELKRITSELEKIQKEIQELTDEELKDIFGADGAKQFDTEKFNSTYRVISVSPKV